MTLSLLIDKKIQGIAGLAVCVDEEEYPTANVVWFSDAIQPLISILILLLKHKTPKAWYWRSLIPAWHPAMDLSRSISCVMQTAVDGAPRASVNHGIIDLLLNYGQAEEVFKVLTTQLAIQFLNEMNLYPRMSGENIVTAHRETDVIQNVELKWIKTIKQAIDLYGENDPRTVWLAYSGLAIPNPCLENSDEIMQIVTGFIRRCTRMKASRVETEIVERGGEKHKADVVFKNEFSVGKPAAIDAGSTTIDLQEGLREPGQFLPGDKTHDLEIAVEGSEASEEAVNRSGLPANSTDTEAVHANIDPEWNEAARQPIDHHARYGFKFSSHAGLSFVIPLLEYIAIQEVLKLNPKLAELNFPGRIITALASRLKIPQHDPILQIVPDLPYLPDSGLYNFISPAAWESLVYQPGDKDKIACRHPIVGEHQCCYITDRSSKFLLYIGDVDKKGFPNWLGNIRIVDKQGIFARPNLNDLEKTTQFLFANYLRRYAWIGLKGLMNREGHVAITKTHLDILFDPKTSDNRIRIAGLDIDPGWVTWLGRVVQFHYDYDGYNHV